MSSVKIVYKDDVRKITVPTSIKYAGVREKISTMFNGLTPSFMLKYEDDEGDLISITNDQELEAALQGAFAKLPKIIVVDDGMCFFVLIGVVINKSFIGNASQTPSHIIPQFQQTPNPFAINTSQLLLQSMLQQNPYLGSVLAPQLMNAWMQGNPNFGGSTLVNNVDHEVQCSECKNRIFNVRYKCSNCPNYVCTLNYS
jgi:hypothetical protein